MDKHKTVLYAVGIVLLCLILLSLVGCLYATELWHWRNVLLGKIRRRRGKGKTIDVEAPKSIIDYAVYDEQRGVLSPVTQPPFRPPPQNRMLVNWHNRSRPTHPQSLPRAYTSPRLPAKVPHSPVTPQLPPKIKFYSPECLSNLAEIAASPRPSHPPPAFMKPLPPIKLPPQPVHIAELPAGPVSPRFSAQTVIHIPTARALDGVLAKHEERSANPIHSPRTDRRGLSQQNVAVSDCSLPEVCSDLQGVESAPQDAGYCASPTELAKAQVAVAVRPVMDDYRPRTAPEDDAVSAPENAWPAQAGGYNEEIEALQAAALRIAERRALIREMQVLMEEDERLMRNEEAIHNLLSMRIREATI